MRDGEGGGWKGVGEGWGVGGWKRGDEKRCRGIRESKRNVEGKDM